MQRKVTRDLAGTGFEECHGELIERIISDFSELPYNRKQGSTTWLTRMYEHVTPYHQNEILEFLLASQYKAVRRRGLKIIRNTHKSGHQLLVERAWSVFKDELCAVVIIEKFPIEFVLREYIELERVLSKSVFVSKLFIRIGGEQPELLPRLESLDGVTYAYVLVKLGRNLSDSQAYALYNRFDTDERIGLLLWCFGQMGLWAVLKKIIEESEDRDAYTSNLDTDQYNFLEE